MSGENDFRKNKKIRTACYDSTKKQARYRRGVVKKWAVEESEESSPLNGRRFVRLHLGGHVGVVWQKRRLSGGTKPTDTEDTDRTTLLHHPTRRWKRNNREASFKHTLASRQRRSMPRGSQIPVVEEIFSSTPSLRLSLLLFLFPCPLSLFIPLSLVLFLLKLLGAASRPSVIFYPLYARG